LKTWNYKQKGALIGAVLTVILVLSSTYLVTSYNPFDEHGFQEHDDERPFWYNPANIIYGYTTMPVVPVYLIGLAFCKSEILADCDNYLFGMFLQLLALTIQALIGAAIGYSIVFLIEKVKRK